MDCGPGGGGGGGGGGGAGTPVRIFIQLKCEISVILTYGWWRGWWWRCRRRSW